MLKYDLSFIQSIDILYLPVSPQNVFPSFVKHSSSHSHSCVLTLKNPKHASFYNFMKTKNKKKED